MAIKKMGVRLAWMHHE